MISSNPKENVFFWAFSLTVATVNALAFPVLLVVWVCLICALVVMNWLRDKLSSLIICTAWGTIGGLACLMGFFLLISSEESRFISLILMAGFTFWTMLLLTEKKEKVRGQMFHLLGPIYMAVQVLTLLILKVPAILMFVMLFEMALYMAIIFNPHTEKGENSESAGRWIVMAMVGAMALSAPIILGKEFINRETSLPSIGSLPRVSTSNEIVMSVEFPKLIPHQMTYWEHRDIYAIPKQHGQWESLLNYTLGKRNNGHEDLLYDNNANAERIGVNKITYPHIVKGEYLGFSMPGTIHHRTGLEPYKGGVGNEVYDQAADRQYNIQHREAWVFYEDKPLRGFTDKLDAMYLSIPDGEFDPSKGVDLEGARLNMPRTWAMVQQWKSEGLNDEQFIERTLEYFKNNLAYHFDHQSEKPEHNELDWFLFTDQKGVCRHFANAFGLIMRMGGIRSRIRGGLYAGEKIADGKIVELRKRDAHAWNEVWMDGKGWVLIDPTAVVPVEKGVPEDKSLFSGMFGGFSSISWMESFSTAGSAGVQGGQTQGVLEKIRSSLLNLSAESIKTIMAILVALVVIGTGLWWAMVSIREFRKEHPCDRQWRLLGKQLARQGVIIGKNNGPRTVGMKAQFLWEKEEGNKWMGDVLDYERWKYSGVLSEGLENRLREWRKSIAGQNRNNQYNRPTTRNLKINEQPKKPNC